MDKSVSSSADLIYRVFHEVSSMEDTEQIESSALRYDLTAIRAGMFKFSTGEREFFKTAGHYHPKVRNIDYPELYEVLSGRALWIIQRFESDPSQVREAYLIEANAGEKILIPPGFGHVTVNAHPELLVISNVIGTLVGHDYEPFSNLQGAAYRLLAQTHYDMIEIERNTNYRNTPDLVKLKPKKDWFKGYFNPLYKTLTHNLDSLAFLGHPEVYKPEFFRISNLYQEIHA